MDKQQLLTWARAIREHSSMDYRTIIEAGEHGADAGWPGFTYYADTVAFYEAHRRDIDELIADQADAFGMNVPEFIASWECADSITDSDTEANAKAWYTLEVVGQRLADARDCPEIYA